MDPLLFKHQFILLFIIKMIITLGLNILNLSHLRKHRGAVPEEMATLVAPEKLSRIDSYNGEVMVFKTVHMLFGNILLIVFLFTPLFPAYTLLIDSFPLPYIIKGLLFFLLLNLIGWGLNLPFDYYFHFTVEKRFGFNCYTVVRWLVDKVKGLFVSTVVITFILSVVLIISGEFAVFNWKNVLLGWTLAFLLVVLFTYLLPVLFIPFFYQLKPLAESSLKNRVAKLIADSGFKLRGIFIAEESSKSTHANAQFAGLGKSKTVILFDTLVQNYTDDEIIAVLAHEIGHGKKRHQLKLLLIALFEIFLFILCASYLLAADFPYRALGIGRILYGGIYIIYVFFFDLLTFFLQPLYSRFSRKLEYEADAFSKALLGTPEPLISIFKKFITNELSNINPHPLYESFHYSHPSLLKRIGALK